MEVEVDSPRNPAPTPVPPSDTTAAPPPASASPAPPSPREDVTDGWPARARLSKRARAAIADDGAGPAASPRRKRRGTGPMEPPATGAAASAPTSPLKRSVRRARVVGREEKGKEVVEEGATGKVRRRKMTGKAQASKGSLVSVKEKGSNLAIVPYRPSNLTRGANNEQKNDCEGLWEMVIDLVMWNNVARSAFWFGSGSMVSISSSLSRDIYFSPISVGCQFGVVMLGLAFFKDSISVGEPPRQFQLMDEDVRLAARAVLPIVNKIISVTESVFSGDASMTLKVLPLLIFGAKFGHLLTTWRLLATGFFGCFTLPKLYSYYSSQVQAKAKCSRHQIINAWKSCPLKKLVMAIAVTTFWNLLSVKSRMLAAFFCLVPLRYYYQHCRMNSTSSPSKINRICGEDHSMRTED